MSSTTTEDDGCICRVCRFSWGLDLPAPEVGTEDLLSLQRQARKLSMSLFKNWVLLNKTLKRYEHVVQKRWIKKNKIQRTKILLTAWPGMAATHRPDFAHLRDVGTKGCKRRVNRVKEREANLWPYINQEDFVHSQNLLTFLNSRGRCLPHKFAFGDNVCAHAAQPSSKCEEINERRMVLHGRCTPNSYAALSTFKAGDEADVLGMHPTAGLLVMEIQERILHFLVSCCRLILHDMELDRIDLCPTKMAPGVPSSASTWRTITALTDEAPYRMPQQLDLDRLCMLVESKRSEAEEHVWSLREDPGYFAQELQEWAEHATEMVLDKHKMRHKSVGKPEFWNRVSKSLIVHAYRSLIFFAELYEGLKLLVRFTKMYGKGVHPTKRLPLELEEQYQRLDKLVDEMRHAPLNDLVVGLPASPPLRSGFERDVKDQSPCFHELTVKPGGRGPTWRVNILFRILLSQDQHNKHGLVNIIGEIQRTLDEHNADSDGITSWVANRFADLALVVEIRHQLDLFQPWSTMWRYHSNTVLHEMEYETIALVDDTVYEAVHCESIKLITNPTALVYPSDKRRSEGTVIRMREAEKSLDLMWKKIDKHCIQHTGYTLQAFLADFLKERGRRLQRTPVWTEPRIVDSNGSCKQQPEREWVLKSLPLQELDPNGRCSHPGKAELLERKTPEKTKIKSRPTVTRHRDHEPAKTTEQKTGVTRVTIKVNKRAFRVFSTIFHIPSTGAQHSQGEVAWTEFLFAMSSIGFAPEKLYGSSWQFEPTNIKVNRSIQFHEPHPQVKMHFWLAKRVGRRLNRAYGWDGNTFVCD